MSPQFDQSEMQKKLGRLYGSKTSYDACIFIEFEFDSEGTDHLIVYVQEADNTRAILDYQHERPAEKERLLLRKFVHFILNGGDGSDGGDSRRSANGGGNVRFFVQFEFDTTLAESKYGLRVFEFSFLRCPNIDGLNSVPKISPPINTDNGNNKQYQIPVPEVQSIELGRVVESYGSNGIAAGNDADGADDGDDDGVNINVELDKKKKKKRGIY